ncbi:MAG: alpha-ketoacid dehydrogenase subunit beta [Anaerolineales bacterium]|jgi:pyruvate dehydrogenase E1 component beta subunit
MARRITVKQAINEALSEELERDDRVILLGCDVGRRGNPFGVTSGLWQKYGDSRVIDTPLSEEGFTGMALGAAATGMRPVVEILYSDWITLAMDQIVNEIAKSRYMFGGKMNVPLVIRAPVGVGGGVAAQHSQSFESWFCHIPGLKVVMPSTASDVKGLLKTSIRGNNPVIFFEHKRSYAIEGEVPDGDYTIPFGQADVKRQGKDLTIVAVSLMVHHALAAAERLSAEEGIECEVIDPRTLVPMDWDTMLASLKKTSRLVVVHESSRTCGIGGEILAELVERGFDYLEGRPIRVAGLDVPIPYNRGLEHLVIPDPQHIVDAVHRALD